MCVAKADGAGLEGRLRAFGCGKVILFGEHAVVYGQPALAAALSEGVEVQTTPDVARSAPILRVPAWDASFEPGDGSRLGEALGRMVAVIEARCGRVGGLSCEASLGVPVGAGLGSSAALAVAVARGMMAASDAPLEDPNARRDVVLAAALASEQVFHGNPSGVDHTTSALGGLLLYKRDATPAFERVDGVAAIDVIIAQMEAGADTGAMVRGVRVRRDAEPALVDAHMGWMGDLTRAATEALQAGDVARVGRLMNLAHGALVGLGVSTARLDEGCHVARAAGAWGAKLTGAGGGGCVVVVAPPEATEAVAGALRRSGAQAILSTRAGAQVNLDDGVPLGSAPDRPRTR